MTVAAVIVPEGIEAALADASGRAAVRRIVEAAWAGGAMPIVIVVTDPDKRVAAALVGSPATVVDPGELVSGAAAYRRGAEAAGAAVHETSAVLLWPGSMTWTDPETVTSLIEAHGRANETIYRPERTGRPGWPVLLPMERVGAVLAGTDRTVAEAVATAGAVGLELGDPGTVIGAEVPLDELPAFEGPPEPVGGPPPEWGAAAADGPDT